MPFTTVPYTAGVYNAYPALPEYAPFNSTIDPSAFAAFVATLGLTSAQNDALTAVAYWESGQLTIVTEGTNPFNFQADQGTWAHITGANGTTVFTDSTGATRRFVVFDTWQDCVTSAAWYIVNRNIYIGAGPDAEFDPNNSVTDAASLYARYARAWIYGDAGATISPTESAGFVQMYNQILAGTAASPAVPPAPPTPTPPMPQPAKTYVLYELASPYMADSTVTAIQAFLNSKGYLPKPGQYDEATAAAVKNWQADNGLDVDGKAGKDTQQSMGL